MSSLTALSFASERLAVSLLADGKDFDEALLDLTRALLQPAVVAYLPLGWSEQAPGDWLEARHAESRVLLVEAIDRNAPIGLVLLTEDEDESRTTIRLGYLLREDSWGRGYASELLIGLVASLRQAVPHNCTLIGGVSKANPASGRVLAKAGFEAVEENETEQFFHSSW